MLCEGKSWRNGNFKMSNQRLVYGVIFGCEAGEKEGRFWKLVKLKKDSFARIFVFSCRKIGGYSFYMMTTGAKTNIVLN